MASVKPRGKGYTCIYTFNDPSGTPRQKWESFSSKAKANARKAEVEDQMNKGTFVAPNISTVDGLLEDFVELYGKVRWGVSIYDANTAIIRNYINPLIGNLHVQDVTTLVVDKLIHQLTKTHYVEVNGRSPKAEFLTPCSISKILRLLHCAFRQAVRWGIVGKNPFTDALGPEVEPKKRDIWDAATIAKALMECRDPKLYVAINLAFASSLRIGEICGLTWDCVVVDDEHIACNDAYVRIEKSLTRVSERAMAALNKKHILFEFPRVNTTTAKTRVVLKTPKTRSSVRQVWLPKTLAYIIREWKDCQDKLKQAMGTKYNDYNMVLALDDGRPCEDAVITNAFKRLKKSAGLPEVVFHSLRHSSTTYKLRLLHGDIKSVQGDNGHAQASMVTEVYGHILDENRKVGAQCFDTAFYSRPDLRLVTNQCAPEPDKREEAVALIQQIGKDPELAALLRATLLGGTIRYA